MSAFRVNGVTDNLVKTKINKNGLTKAPNETDAEFFDSVYKKITPAQVSPAFDAPQFCEQWIELAKKTSRCRALKIMVYDLNGKITKKGTPAKSWQPYAPK